VTVDSIAKLLERNLALFLDHAEELLDDEFDEEDLESYRARPGATEEELEEFQRRFDLTLPQDFLAAYRYKNGSGSLPLLWPQEGFYWGYQLLSLGEMEQVKTYFQNVDRELADFPELLKEAEPDRRVKPHLSCERWFPFAQYAGSLYLMLDYDPADAGQAGQIICYIHDPDHIEYVAPSLTEVLERTQPVIEGLC